MGINGLFEPMAAISGRHKNDRKGSQQSKMAVKDFSLFFFHDLILFYLLKFNKIYKILQDI